MILLSEGHVGVSRNIDSLRNFNDDNEVGNVVNIFVKIDEIDGVQFIYKSCSNNLFIVPFFEFINNELLMGRLIRYDLILEVGVASALLLSSPLMVVLLL